MYSVMKRFHFSAAHRLDQLPDGHPCRNMHGHNYEVDVIVSSERLNENGMVIDYRDLAVIVNPIISGLDHSVLNDAMINPPTAEHIANMLCVRIRRGQSSDVMVAVRVSETPNTWAEYR